MARTYYISPDGNDAADGRSPATAWKTIARIGSVKLTGGDEMLLRRGGVWREKLFLPGEGLPDRPIVIGAYGQGDRPCIDGGDPIDPLKFTATTMPGLFAIPVEHAVQTVWENLQGSLAEAQSLADVAAKQRSFFCDGKQLFVHPDRSLDPRSALIRFEIPARELDVELNKSHVAIRSIAVRHAGRTDRGAVTVWADHDLQDIELTDCDISFNCGRGAWFCGPASRSIHDVVIAGNIFRCNDGSGLLMILADGAKITGNNFDQNCRRPIEAWQGGIRLWSQGIRNLRISDNTITHQRWGHDRDSAMGIHCDETGEHVVISDNLIRETDHAGIAVENTRGVTVEKNILIDCNIGVFINRAGHDHIVRGNTVIDSRSQGIAIQGWLAHGVDAQPEIVVEGRLLTRNLFENNTAIGSHWGNLKAVNGGQLVDPPLGNLFRDNDLGPERPGFIEWGEKSFDRYDQWPVANGGSHGK